MLRLAFDFIITWRETRTRPNAYHWSIGNNLHWQLDVTFREDYSKKVKNAAGNFSVATKMALTILKNEKTTKGSMNLKRLKAGWDENYLSQLLQDNNF